MRSFALVAAALAGAHPLAAQAPVTPTAMRELDWLVGEWRGTGRMMVGRNEFRNASITERATRHAGGHAMTLEGLGKALIARDSVTVHNAFALIWHDAEAGRFRIRTFRATGHTVDADIEVTDGRIVWGFDDPRAGRVRFTVSRTDDGRWHEIGETSRDGTNWMQFMEMTLSRVDPGSISAP